MIKTQLTGDDLRPILELGYKFHQESQFKQMEYDPEKIARLLYGSIQSPDKVFFAYDDSFKGLILLQMSTQFFSGNKWAGDQAFYVVPEARNTGLAQELLQVGQDWARANGAADFVIFHNAGLGMEKAKSFYDKQGFDLSGLIFNKRLT